MGQKVNPIVLRLSVNKDWNSKWYAKGKEYANLLHEDLKIKSYIRKELKQAAVSKVVVERPAKKAIITIHTARPGVVIGKKGSDIEKIKQKISKITKGDIQLNIVEVRKPELDAQLIADNIAEQLERRASFRRTMKRAIQSALRLGAEGIKIVSGGRLGGAEIARIEWYREGRVPLHSLRADIDYGVSTSHTAYGTIGIKVWVYKGEQSTDDKKEVDMTKTSFNKGKDK
ncbi:30S ribosomal protein S3 [Alphaproteobacteria bacterium]|nr:30S ribosomal protein S3 [Alphaproteobacteria bacterium]